MHRLFGLSLFLGVFATITATVHYYIWARLVRDTGLPTPATRWLTAILVLLFLSMPLSFGLSRTLPPEHGRGILLVIYSWMGIMLYLLLGLGLSDLSLGLYRLAAHLRQLSGQQGALLMDCPRFALERWRALAVVTLAVTLSGVALVGANRPPRILEIRTALPRLPPALAGTVVAHISDLHLGPTLRRGFLEQVVARTNALAPDLVVITGDFADGTVDRLREMVTPLRELHARWGVFFVTGNHEYYNGVEAWCAEIGRLGVRVLRGEMVSIGEGSDSFDLVGLDDLEARRFDGPASTDLARIVRNRDPRRELLLLAHQPQLALEAQRNGVGLQLSGHTHGGQLWPWGVMVRLQQPVVHGISRFGQTIVSVNNGTGYWGPPMRLGAPAEITKFILIRGNAPPLSSVES